MKTGQSHAHLQPHAKLRRGCPRREVDEVEARHHFVARRNLDDDSWAQAQVKLNKGGLGLRAAEKHSPAAYRSSRAKNSGLCRSMYAEYADDDAVDARALSAAFQTHNASVTEADRAARAHGVHQQQDRLQHDRLLIESERDRHAAFQTWSENARDKQWRLALACGRVYQCMRRRSRWRRRAAWRIWRERVKDGPRACQLIGRLLHRSAVSRLMAVWNQPVS